MTLFYGNHKCLCLLNGRECGVGVGGGGTSMVTDRDSKVHCIIRMLMIVCIYTVDADLVP